MHHPKACVERISAELAKTPAGQRRLQAAEERTTRWCVRHGEELMAGSKEGELTEEEKAAVLADAAAESAEAPPTIPAFENFRPPRRTARAAACSEATANERRGKFWLGGSWGGSRRGRRTTLRRGHGH